METRLNKFSRSKINASFSSTTTNGTKMSDKDGEEERRQSVEDERPETSEKEKTNLNLKNATHKLKAEALRRLQLSGEKKLDQEEKQVKSSANEPSRPATANAQNEFDRSRNLDSTKRREQAVDDPADLEEARAKELDQEEKHKVDDSEVKPSESSHELLNKINNVSKKELRGDLPESEIQVLTPKITTEGYISETVKKSDVRPTAGTYYIDKQPTLISDVQNISSQSQHDADDKTVDRQSWLSSTSNNLSVVTESIPTEEASRQLTDNTIEKKAVKTTISNSQSSKESIELAEPSIVPVTNDPNSTSSSSDKGVNDPVGESEDIGSKSNTSPSDHRESTKQVIWKSELAFATDESRKEPEIDGSYSTEKRNGIFGKSDGAIENKEVNQQLMSGKDQEVLIESDTSETEQLSSLTEDKAKKIVHSNDMSDPTHYNNPYPKHPEDDLKKNSAVLSDNTKEVKNDSKLDQNKENADYKANVTVSEGPNMKNGYESPSDTNENKGDATLNENEENMIETDNDAVTEIQESQKDKEQGRDTKMKSSLSTTTVKNSMEDQPSIADQRLPDQVSAIENDTSNVKENDKNPLDAGSVLGSSFSHDIGNSKTKLSTGDENQEGSFSNVPRELEDNVQGQNLTASEIKCEDVDGNTSGLALKVEESSLEPSAMSTDDKKADIGNVAPGNEINAREDKGPATSGEQQEVTSSLKGNGGNKDDNQGKDKEQLVTGEDGDSGMVAVEDKENPENEGDSLRKDDEVEEEERIPEDFYYEYDKYKSIPYATDEVPLDLLSLYHSFGYECTKRSNLHMLDEDHILFSAGNMVEILNIKSNEIKYLRTVGGGGIGAVAVHPDRTHFAVAEKGIKPDIIIYEYPSLRMYRILRNGTEEAYSNLDFSPTGEKLASVGSAPDFMLTVWDWRQEKVMLRTKAFSQDVYKVAFSPEDEGHLCTSGTGHIRFWSMASTFTGLKLQGEIGRFGTTELSDIAGFVELPDGKVLSGSEWGNMLLWEGGLIKVEISRKGKKTCHQGMIEQFFLDEGELITIGVDGYVKVWDFESIDTADAVDESKLFEMEPMSELKVGSDVKLMSMVKSVNPDQTSIWYAQDAAGGIWKLDLSFSHTSQAPKKLLSYHAGKINGIDVSPFTHIAATVGDDNTVRLFDYLGRKPLCYSRFTAPGTSILWVPKVVDPEALSILAGFADGVMRHLTVAKIDASTTAAKKALSDVELKLTQVFKPHTKCVTSIAISGDGKFLATGSEDCTVFFFSIGKKYDPIGFIETGATAVSLSWSSIKQGSNLLVCCKDGSVLEVACPDPGKNDTSKTFLIPLPGLKKKEFKFKSVKDDLIAAEEAERKAKEEEEKRRIEEEEKRRRRERGIIEEEDEDEEKEENKEEKEESEEETIQEKEVHVPGFIVRGFYRGEPGKFCLFLDGWDAGYLYECEFPELNENSSEEDICCEPVKSIKLNDIDDVSVKAFHFSKRGQYLVLGLENGALRIHLLETHEMKQLNSYWLLNVHDNQFGAILSLTMSHDDRFLLCVAADGNFFTFSFMDEGKLKAVMGEMKAKLAAKAESAKLKHVDDIEDPNFYSIELEKQKLEHDRMLKRAEEKKQQVRQTINLLRRDFKKIVSKSQELPSYLQLPQSEFVIDPEMRKDIERETEDKIELLKRELAWESEKHLIGLRKLQRRYEAPSATEEIKKWLAGKACTVCTRSLNSFSLRKLAYLLS